MNRERIAVMVGGRDYGTSLAEDAKFLSPLPEIEVFRELAIKLRQQSALLKVEFTPDLTKHALLEAYGSDLRLLTKHQEEFEACIKQAIRCSVIARKGDTRQAETWQELKEEIPAIGQEPLLRLPHTRAAKPVPELLGELKEEFSLGVERVLRISAYWLQVLVEEQYVGLVVWSGIDVGCYHFFRHESTDEVLSDHTAEETSYDESKQFGERTEYKTVRHKSLRHKRFGERHVHHIMDAKLNTLGEYQKPVPTFVADFLDSAPAWLKQHFTIVSGTITMEEKLRLRTHDDVVETAEVIAVKKGSPAVALGHFSLIGWSDDDMRGEVVEYKGQTGSSKRKEVLISREGWIAGGFVAVVLSFMFGAASYIVVSGNKAAQAAYAQFTTASQGQEVKETGAGAVLDLPLRSTRSPQGMVQTKLYYVSPGRGMSPSLRFTTDTPFSPTEQDSMRIRGVTHTYSMKSTNPVLYGEIDLAQDFGIFVKVRVIEATDEKIRYTVTRY